MAVRFPDIPQAIDIEKEVAVIPRYEDFRKFVSREGIWTKPWRAIEVFGVSQSMRIPITFM